MTKSHYQFGPLEIGKFCRIILHGLKQNCHSSLSSGKLIPVAPLSGSQNMQVLMHSERHRPTGNSAALPVRGIELGPFAERSRQVRIPPLYDFLPRQPLVAEKL